MSDPEDQGFRPDGTPAGAETDLSVEYRQWKNDVTLVCALQVRRLLLRDPFTEKEMERIKEAATRLGIQSGLLEKE